MNCPECPHCTPVKPKSTYKEGWVDNKWRPAMGWMYFTVCLFDFVIAPILWSLIQAYFKGNVTDQWDPITLQGAGLFHMAMGAVLGVAVWSRGKEKMVGVAGPMTNAQIIESQKVDQNITTTS